MKSDFFKFYEVGGKVRDEILGIVSKDIDYVVVPHQTFLEQEYDADGLFRLLHLELSNKGYEIFLVTADCFTIRAKFPKVHKNEGIVADFVMSRKEIGYHEGTRKPILVPGTLHDDLERRDFTVNAIAKDPDTGRYIDPFGGMDDLVNRVLKTPIDPVKTMNDDPLRLLRAIRFSITKQLFIHPDILRIIRTFDYNKKMKVVSEERIREELHKCFKADSFTTMQLLLDNVQLAAYIFGKTKLWLKPTNES